jgi:hypothetical protein
MARRGETIENPVNGERITWIETAQGTAGELLAFDLDLRPGGAVAVEHRHVRQEEHFEVLSGTVGFELTAICMAFRDLGDSCPQLVKPPPVLQRGVFAALAPIGRLLGRRAVYPEYSPPHQSPFLSCALVWANFSRCIKERERFTRSADPGPRRLPD